MTSGEDDEGEIIDVNKIELSVLENFKGGEKATEAHMFVDENNRMLMGRLVPGASIGLHRHEGNSEVVLIKKGTGKVLFPNITDPRGIKSRMEDVIQD